MSDADLNGLPALRGDLLIPYQGAITAELDLDADEAPSGAVTLTYRDRTFACTVVADPTDSALRLSGDSGGFKRCRVVGGAGGLDRALEPQEFAQGALVQQLLDAILAGSGETWAADISADLLTQVVPQWSWTAGTVRNALDALVQYLGVVWRIRADGRLWIGTPAPAAVAAPAYTLIDIAPEAGQACWSMDELSVEPDQIIDGLTIRQVSYSWTESLLNVLVSFAPGPVNPLYALFGLWMRRLNIDYFRLTPGRIAAQNGNGTFQVQPDNSRYSGFKQVGVRLGLPDTVVQLDTTANNRSVLGWEGAAPTGPVHIGFGESKAALISLADSAGSKFVARLGDDIDMGSLSVTLGSGGVSSVIWTPPGGGIPVTIATAPAATPITGKISSASSIVKAG